MQPERRLKVAMVVPVGVGGYLRFSLSLCEALSQSGVDTTLITSRDSDELPDHENGFRVLPVLGGMNRRQARAFRGLSYSASLLSLRRRLKQEHFDIAHFQDTFVPFADAPFFMLAGKETRTVFTAHDPDQDAITKAKSGKLGLRRLALSRIYRAADGIVVMSGCAREDVVNGFGVPEKKVARIAHGNYRSYGADQPPSKDEARRKLGIAADRKLVLFFGSLKPSKGVDHLLRAFVCVHAADPSAYLLIAGETRGLDPSVYPSQLAALGVAEAVSLRPDYVATEDVPYYFAAADLVVLPYLRIYQSGVLHLAYSFGRPVVASRVGGLAEDVVEGKSGLLVPPGDEQALADAILELIASPQRLESMGDYGRMLSQTAYSWDEIARQTVRFYESLL